jgi:hypothetical protein
MRETLAGATVVRRFLLISSKSGNKFFTPNRDFGRCFDPNANRIASDPYDRHDDILVNDQPLALLTG